MSLSKHDQRRRKALLRHSRIHDNCGNRGSSAGAAPPGPACLWLGVDLNIARVPSGNLPASPNRKPSSIKAPFSLLLPRQHLENKASSLFLALLLSLPHQQPNCYRLVIFVTVFPDPASQVCLQKVLISLSSSFSSSSLHHPLP